MFDIEEAGNEYLSYLNKRDETLPPIDYSMFISYCKIEFKIKKEDEKQLFDYFSDEIPSWKKNQNTMRKYLVSRRREERRRTRKPKRKLLKKKISKKRFSDVYL